MGLAVCMPVCGARRNWLVAFHHGGEEERLVQVLLQHGADPNAQDLGGPLCSRWPSRTPSPSFLCVVRQRVEAAWRPPREAYNVLGRGPVMALTAPLAS